MRLRIEVTARRGAIRESRHRIEAAVVGAGGERVAATGEPELITTFRSAAKPFQLLPLVERGHADAFGFSDADLAVMAASHTGAERHLERVAGILARIGRTAADLACGYHDPLDPDARRRVAADPGARGPLHNNCSGKHAGMLALAIAEGWPTAGYERPDHPVQRLLHHTVAELAGLPPAEVLVGVDGCSAAVFGLPLSRMARAYAALASATPDGDPRPRALARIRAAMAAHPGLVGGRERFSTSLMEACGGAVVSKGGAEGLECAAVPAGGLGLALKVVDGNDRAVPPAMVALLERIGALAPEARRRLADFERPVQRNVAGLEVGVLEVEARTLSPVGA